MLKTGYIVNKDWYFLYYILNNKDSKDKTFETITCISTKLSTLFTRAQSAMMSIK